MSQEVVIKLRVDGAKDSATAIKAVESALQQQGIQVQSVGAKSEAAAASVKGLGSATTGAAQAADASGNSFRTAAKQMDAVGISAKQTAAAMRNVPAQFTDIVTQLQGGANPMTVLMQQGGQLKDMFGGIGPAAKALGTYVVGLVTPFTVATAAVGALTVAMYQGSQAHKEYERALIMSGNAAGVTAGQMQQMAASIAASNAGVSGSAATDALVALASSGRVASDVLQKNAETTAAWSKVTGISVADVAKDFAALAKDPLAASLKLTEQYNYLTESTYSQIKALQEAGRYTEAAAVAQKAYADMMGQRAPEMEKNLGTLVKGWNAVSGAIGGAWEAVLKWGAVPLPETQLDALRKTLDAAEKKRASISSESAFAPALDKEIDRLREQVKLMGASVAAKQADAQADAARGQRVQANTKWDEVVKANLSAEAKQREEIVRVRNLGIAAGKTEQEIAEQIAAIKAKSAKGAVDSQSEAAGIRAQIKEAERYLAALQELDGAAKKSLPAEQAVAKLREELAGNLSAGARAAKQSALAEAERLVPLQRAIELEQERIKYNREAIDTLTKQADSIAQRAVQQERANATFGMAKSALEELTLAELEQTKAALEQTETVIPGYLEQLDRRIAAQKQLVDAMKKGEVLEANADAAKKAQEEWRRSSEYIRDTITGALMRGFESGKGFWQNFRDTIKNTILTVTVQPVVKSIVGSVLGLGGSAAAVAGQGGAPSASMSMFDTFSRSFDRLGASVSGSMMRAGDYLSTSSSNFAAKAGDMMSANAQMMGTMAKYGVAGLAGIGIGNAVSGQYGGNNKTWVTGIYAAIGAAMGGPMGAVIGGAVGGLVNRAFGMGETKVAGQRLVGTLGGNTALQTRTDYQKDGGWFRSDKSWSEYSNLADKDMAVVRAQVGTLRRGVADYAKALGLSTDRLGSYTMRVDSTASDSAVKDALTKFASGLANTTANFSGFRRGLETSIQAMERLVKSTTVFDQAAKLLFGVQWRTDSSQSVGASSIAMSGLGSLDIADRKDRIIAKFGGADAFASTAQGFFDAFYSEAEKTARKTELLNDSFAQLGIAVPKTREEFKQLANSLAGAAYLDPAAADTYAKVMQLGPAFAELVPWATDAAKATSELANSAADLAQKFQDAVGSLANEKSSLEDQLYALQRAAGLSSITERDRYLQKSTAGMDATQASAIAAAYDYNDALKQQIAALQSAAQAAADAAAKEQAAAQQRSGLEAQLLQLQGDTAALRARELAALEPSNRALQEQIYALQDSQSAAQAAAQAAQEQAQAARDLAVAEQATAQQRYGLEAQLLQLQGNTAALRARELAALEPSNRALQEQIYALQDSQSAAQAAAQAAQEQAQAAQQAAQEQAQAAAQLRQAWESIGNTMQDEVNRIRGLLTEGSGQSYEALQSQFAIATAQARAGDQTAAGQLAGLSQSMLAAAANSATNSVDLARIQASTAASLEATMRALSYAGVKLPSFDVGTNFVPQDMLALIHAGEAIVPRAYNPAAGGAAVSSPGDVGQYIQQLHDRMLALQADNSAENTAMVALLQRMARILDDVSQGGTTIRTTAV